MKLSPKLSFVQHHHWRTQICTFSWTALRRLPDDSWSPRSLPVSVVSHHPKGGAACGRACRISEKVLYWLTDAREQFRLIPIAVGGDQPAPFRESCKAGGAAIGTQPISRCLCRCHHRPVDIAQHLLPVIRLVMSDHSVEHMDQLVGDSTDRLDLL